MKTTKSESDELGPEYRRALPAGTLAAFVDSRRGAEGRRTHIPPRAPRPPAPRQRATTIEKTGDSEVGHGTLAGSLGVETRDSPVAADLKVV